MVDYMMVEHYGYLVHMKSLETILPVKERLGLGAVDVSPRFSL